MGKHFYIDLVDYIRWADFSTVQNANLTAGQGVVEQFGLTLRNYAPIDEFSVGGVLPALPNGHAPVLYIDVAEPDTGPPYSTYDILFSGIVTGVDGSDGDWRGGTIITVVTPMKFLKIVVHSLVMRPDPGLQPTDTSRIRYIGQRLGGQLPNFDFDRYVAANDAGNISYPVPNWPPHNDGTDADEYTNYLDMTIEDIIRAIATDPGDFQDPLYPAQARNWWVEADFVSAGDPSSGIRNFIHYQNVPVPSEVVDLVGEPYAELPDAVYYEQGSKYTTNYMKVIRQINIAGPSGYPGGYSYRPNFISFLSGTTLDVAQRAGVAWKWQGDDGVWDTAVASGNLYYDDMEVSAQIQEVYLEHDTFQRPDGPPSTGIQGLGVTNHGTAWLGIDGKSPLHVRNGHAAAAYLISPYTGLNAECFGVLECYGTNVNLRTHLAVNRKGMSLLFRYNDYYNFWAVRAEADGYHLYKVVGGTWTPMGTIVMPRVDMHEIKVALTNIGDGPDHSYVDVYINDVQGLHVVDDFQCHYSQHGLLIDCVYDPEAFEGEFYDFQCTSFYGDRALGMGNNDMTPDDGDGYLNPTWVYISYGFVMNSDGGVRIIHGGDPLDPSEWEPDTYEANHGYLYNDRFKVSAVKYIDPDDHSVKRKVWWEKQASGEGEWILLAQITPITEPDGPSMTSPWRAQYAGKDLGAAVSKLTAGMAWSNMFYAPDTEAYPPLYGGNHLYAATQVLQSDTWTTYIKRQKVADGIFRAEGNAALTFTCTTMHQFHRGDFARITNRRAGWTNPLSGPDTRPTMMCTAVQRVETGNRRVPKYACTFGTYIYSSDDPGRTHLLAPMVAQGLLYDQKNVADPEFDGMALSFDDSALAGIANANGIIQVMLIPQDQVAEASTLWPILQYHMPIKRASLPVSWFEPGTKLTAHHRVITGAGVSDWSAGTPFKVPPRPATDRLSVVMWYIGDGVNPITSDAPHNVYDEIQINQPCKIVGWAVDLADVVGDLEFDIQYASATDRRVIGTSAFANISGSGSQSPAVVSTLNTGTYNDGFNMAGWDGAAFALKAGDRLRLVVRSASFPGDPATKGTLDLMFAALNVPSSQAAGTPTGAGSDPPGSGGGDPSANQMADEDGERLIDEGGQPLT